MSEARAQRGATAAHLVPAAAGAPGGRAALALDVLLVIAAASTRVLVELARGLVHAGSDLGSFFIPNAAWWWSRPRWGGGWNPWIFGGYPADADPQIAPLFPLSLLNAVVSPLAAVTIEGALLPALAAVGMLLYLRAAGCGRTGALIGALSFGLGGYMTGHVMHPGLLRAAAAVPWALAALEALDGRALVAGLGAATGCLLLGGHPQGSAYALTVVVLYALWLGYVRPPARLAVIAAGLALGVALAAGALLPFVQFAARSTRGVGAAEGLPNPMLDAGALAGLLTPFALGGSAGALYGDTLPRRNGCSPTECSGYPGVVTWIVVLCGLPLVVRDARGRFWVVLAVVSLPLAAGLPDVTGSGVRAASRFLAWWNVAFAAVAGFAWRALDASLRTRPPRWWIGVALVALMLAAVTAVPLAAPRTLAGSGVLLLAAAALLLATRRRPRAAAAGAVLLAAVDMTSFAASSGFGVTVAQHRASTAGVDAIAAALRQTAPGADARPRAVVAPALADPNWAALAQVPLVQGYSPLVPATIAGLLGPRRGSSEIGLIDAAVLTDPASHVLDVLRVGVVGVPATAPKLPGRAALDDESRWRALDAPSGAKLRFFASVRALPVAWLVDRARVADDAEQLRLVTAGGDAFDPAREALVREPVAGLAPFPPGATGRVTLATYGEDEIVLHVDAPATALLVTSELAHPGWTAMIDGVSAPLLEVNGGFRAVVVPAGRHLVQLAYRPLATRIGLAVSALALLVLGWCGTASLRDGRGAAGRTPAPCPGS